MTAKVTPPSAEQTAAVAGHARDGFPLHLAAHLAKFDPDLAQRWFARGEAGKRAYVAFFEAVRNADAAHTRELLTVVVDAADRGSKRAARFLKRFRRENPAVPVPDVKTRRRLRAAPS
jgi:hypothetical protein